MNVNAAANNLLAPALSKQALNLLNCSYTGLTRDEKHKGNNWRMTYMHNAGELQRLIDRLQALRRERGTERVVSHLQAQWETDEKATMRRELLEALDFEAALSKALAQDKNRYDCQMGHHYEESGYYDQDAA